MSKFVPWNSALETTVHKLSWLTVSVVLTVIVLLAACSVTNGGTTQQETEEPLQSSATPLSDTAETVSTAIAAGEPIRGNEVEVTVDKTVYQAGERVRYTITNHGDRPVYYGAGHCDIPFIVRLEDGSEVVLMIYILEEEIPMLRLEAGETLSCTWSQHAYSTEGGKFAMRQVPPGQYQIRLPNVLEEEDMGSGDTWEVAKSQVFTVE
jgi:hypothetical protein